MHIQAINLYIATEILEMRHKPLLLHAPQVLKHGAGIRDLKWVGAVVLSHLAILDEKLLDLVVVDHGGVSPGALAEASLTGPGALKTHAASESGGTIRE